MEENKKRGASFFYAVVGVATLVVAIVGATFAYFSASATNDNAIQGEAATAGLSLRVDIVSAGAVAAGRLVPLQDGTASAPYNVDHIDNALLAGSPDRICIDDNNNPVCQLYRITVENTGDTTINLTGTLKLTADGYTNLKWLNFGGETGFDPAGDGACVSSDMPSSKSKCLSAVTNSLSDTVITSQDNYTANETKVYYVLIYIAETGEAQDNADKGSFTGVVTFNGVNGKGVTSTFNG